MLTELYAAVFAWLAEAGLTAYAEDAVPDKAAFPYASCRIEAPLTMRDEGQLAVTCHSADTAQAEKLDMADKLLRLVPTGGVKLPLAHGLAVLHRPDSPTAPQEKRAGVTGLRIRFGLRVYGAL